MLGQPGAKHIGDLNKASLLTDRTRTAGLRATELRISVKFALCITDLLPTQLADTPRVERCFAGESIVDPR